MWLTKSKKPFVWCCFCCYYGRQFFRRIPQQNTKPADDNTAIIAEYEARLAGIAIVNRELQKANSRITEYNNRITKRLDDAKTIIDGIDGQLEKDGDTIQRIIDTLSKLEYAISIIFENWTPKK